MSAGESGVAKKPLKVRRKVYFGRNFAGREKSKKNSSHLAMHHHEMLTTEANNSNTNELTSGVNNLVPRNKLHEVDYQKSRWQPYVKMKKLSLDKVLCQKSKLIEQPRFTHDSAQPNAPLSLVIKQEVILIDGNAKPMEIVPFSPEPDALRQTANDIVDETAMLETPLPLVIKEEDMIIDYEDQFQVDHIETAESSFVPVVQDINPVDSIELEIERIRQTARTARSTLQDVTSNQTSEIEPDEHQRRQIAGKLPDEVPSNSLFCNHQCHHFFCNLKRYLDANKVNYRTLSEIMKFSEQFGYISSQNAKEISEALNDIDCVESKKANTEIWLFCSYLQNVLKLSSSIPFILGSVAQIFRFISIESGIPSNLTLKTALKADMVERFFRQINHDSVAAFYAINLKQFLNYLLFMYKNPPFKTTRIEKLKPIVEVYIERGKKLSTPASSNVITRNATVLKKLKQILSQEITDNDFVMNYLKAYVRLECQKPDWVFHKATMRDFRSTTVHERFDYQVMLVANDNECGVVVWKSDASHLLDHYVKYCRPKSASSHLFLDSCSEPVSPGATDITTFIVKYHGRPECTDIPTQVDSQTFATALNARKRNVGIQCGFNIILKSSSPLPEQNYCWKSNENRQVILTPINSYGDLQKPLVVDAGTDPFEFPKDLNDATTQTEKDESYVIVVRPKTLVIQPPTSFAGTEQNTLTKNAPTFNIGTFTQTLSQPSMMQTTQVGDSTPAITELKRLIQETVVELQEKQPAVATDQNRKSVSRPDISRAQFENMLVEFSQHFK